MVIEKLLEGWKDFKNYLKHKKKEMSLEDLVTRLRIEEGNRSSEKTYPSSVRVNQTEKKGPKAKKHELKLGPKRGIEKKKFKGKCFNCGKVGHKTNECRRPKNKEKEANIVDDIAKDVRDISLVVVISEVNLVASNQKEWWIDTGATKHVCTNRDLFSSFTAVEGKKFYMGNSASCEVKGQGKVLLKMTSGKVLTLTNVLYVPEVRKNLVSGSLLSKNGFRIVFESDKVVLSKCGMYVGRGYATDDLFKLNVIALSNDNNKNNSSSAHMIECSFIWHGRLGHVNYDSI